MATRRSVVFNGDLGSGKSTVSRLLSERLGIRRISVGDFYREMAQQRGMTALQLNLHAELDDKVDFYVDQLQSDIAGSGEQVIVDSRLAWFFFTGALKVHLVTEPSVAAQRAVGRPADTVESYASIDEAQDGLAKRSESERIRFISRYGVDKTRLRNYDLVCDSTRATPLEVVDRVVETFQTLRDETVLFIDPERIYPTTFRGTEDEPVRLGYARPHFFVIDGHRRVAEAIGTGQALVEAILVAEADELVDERSASTYFADECTLFS
ncbi:MAG TPA: AAA family ATPase [Micromonosporaceae bacterium]|nr:AAA family ATPase [Micromonosporaceae bacterium]